MFLDAFLGPTHTFYFGELQALKEVDIHLAFLDNGPAFPVGNVSENDGKIISSRKAKS